MVETAAALKLASAIQTQEGYFPGSLSFRNNNPGNLRFVGQRGAVAGDGGFAAYPSYKEGLAALLDQIQLNASRGADAAGRPVVTVADLIYSWAPPSENNTAAYVASVERQTGFAGGDVLNQLGGQGSEVDVPEFAPAGLPDLPAGSLAALGIGAAALVWLTVR
jgi:hypothetical protein